MRVYYGEGTETRRRLHDYRESVDVYLHHLPQGLSIAIMHLARADDLMVLTIVLLMLVPVDVDPTYKSAHEVKESVLRMTYTSMNKYCSTARSYRKGKRNK